MQHCHHTSYSPPKVQTQHSIIWSVKKQSDHKPSLGCHYASRIRLLHSLANLMSSRQTMRLCDKVSTQQL